LESALAAITANASTVAITGGPPTTANCVEVIVRGMGGMDVITLQGASDNNRTPWAAVGIVQGAGNDTLTGGSGTNIISDSIGNSLITAQGTADTVSTASGNSTVITRDGNDIVSDGSSNCVIPVGNGNDTITAG
jgi:Ca2+-binding RTX toxin-like protein